MELLVTLTDGSESSYTTDAEGTFRIDGIESGVCEVRADRGDRDLLHTLFFEALSETALSARAVAGEHERWRRKTVRGMEPEGKRNAASEDLAIALVVEHRVRDGDTMAAIAEEHGLSEDELWLFNFDTTDEAELQGFLRREVGCTERDPETGLFIFTARDYPGTIYVPKELKRSGLQTGLTHVIRTVPPDPYPAALRALGLS